MYQGRRLFGLQFIHLGSWSKFLHTMSQFLQALFIKKKLIVKILTKKMKTH